MTETEYDDFVQEAAEHVAYQRHGDFGHEQVFDQDEQVIAFASWHAGEFIGGFVDTKA